MEQIAEACQYSSLDVLIARSSKPAQVLRALAVKNDLAGMARSQIALMLGRSVSFVSKWRLIYDQYGTDGLICLHQGGSPRAFLTQPDKEAVLAYLQSQPTMTLPQLRDYLQSCYQTTFKAVTKLPSKLLPSSLPLRPFVLFTFTSGRVYPPQKPESQRPT